jgi:hypothetical protein
MRIHNCIHCDEFLHQKSLSYFNVLSSNDARPRNIIRTGPSWHFYCSINYAFRFALPTPTAGVVKIRRCLWDAQYIRAGLDQLPCPAFVRRLYMARRARTHTVAHVISSSRWPRAGGTLGSGAEFGPISRTTLRLCHGNRRGFSPLKSRWLPYVPPPITR